MILVYEILTETLFQRYSARLRRCASYVVYINRYLFVAITELLKAEPWQFVA